MSKKDYTVSYRDNKKAGTAQVIVKGRRNYEGSVTAEFRIQPLDINDSSITAKNIYTVLGSSNKTSYRPKITVKYGWITLKESTEDVQRDYSVDWSDLQTDEDGYVTAGSYTVTLNGCGNYTGSRSISFEVLPSDCRFMNKVKVSASKKQMDYFEQENVDFTLTYSEAGTVEELIEGEDYVVLYPEKLVLGRNTITLMAIKGSGYYGSRTYSLNVTGKKISSADITIEGIENAYDYTGKAVTVGEDGLDTLKLTDNTRDVVLTEGKDGDYTLSYEKNINAGTATLTITGRNGYSGRKNIKFKINKINMAEDDRNFSIQTEDSAVYTKLGAKVKTTIQYKEQTLTEGKDYTATYQNNKRIGSASVSIKGKGNYAGEFTKNFTVVPSDASHVSFEVEDVSLNARIHAATLRPKMYITEKSTGRKLTPLTDYDNQIRYYTDEACTQEVTESDMVAGKILWAQLTLKGNYTSGDEAQTLIDSFYLYGTNVSSASIEEIPVQNVNGSSLRPANVVKEKQKIKLDIAEPFADLITNLL